MICDRNGKMQTLKKSVGEENVRGRKEGEEEVRERMQ